MWTKLNKSVVIMMILEEIKNIMKFTSYFSLNIDHPFLKKKLIKIGKMLF